MVYTPDPRSRRSDDPPEGSGYGGPSSMSRTSRNGRFFASR